MMMEAKISAIDYFLPEKIVSNRDIEAEFGDWSAQKIEEKTGIRERHVVSENETALDLAYGASKKLFEKYDKNEIDFLLLCTQSPDYYLPTGACILQNKLGLRTDIGALDFNLGCSGYIYGLTLAKGLIKSGISQNVLLVMAETYTKLIHPKDRANRTIFGDGASASIVSATNDECIHEFVLGTDGSGYKNLIVPNGGLCSRYDPSAPIMTDEAGNVRTDNNIYMNGPEIFNFTIGAVPQLFNKVLEKNHTTLDAVDYIIFHQANKYMIEYLRKKIKIPENKFYLNMLHTGNTVSSTIPIALKDCMDTGIIRKGNRVMLVGFGVGYSWGGTIITI